MAALSHVAGMVAPLVLATASTDPALTGAGCALFGVLFYLTTTKPTSPIESSHERAAVVTALRRVVATSPANRITRLALGGVHAAAAASLANRGARLVDGDVSAFALSSAGVSALAALAVVWFSSGFDGQ